MHGFEHIWTKIQVVVLQTENYFYIGNEKGINSSNLQRAKIRNGNVHVIFKYLYIYTLVSTFSEKKRLHKKNIVDLYNTSKFQ